MTDPTTDPTLEPSVPPAAPTVAPTEPATTWTPPPRTPGASEVVYADVPNRAVAYIIDVIIIGIIGAIIGSVLGSLGLSPVTIDSGTLEVSINIVGVLVSSIVGIVISAAYFVYTWTSMRATIGMRILGMQIGNAGDGQALTTNQALRRWLVIAAPSILAQVLFVLPLIGFAVGLASIAWFIFLVYTTAKSPTKQGFHDVFANSQVVKAARSAV